MKAKISKIGSESKEFYIPLIKGKKCQLKKVNDGYVIQGVYPTTEKYILQIGNYTYLINDNGKIINGNNKTSGISKQNRKGTEQPCKNKIQV